MKISVDDKELFTLSDIQKKVICNDINEDIFDKDMQQRLNYIVMHKYEQCFKRLKEEWEPKLKNMGTRNIPLDNDEFAKLVFSQATYKSRKTRELL